MEKTNLHMEMTNFVCGNGKLICGNDKHSYQLHHAANEYLLRNGELRRLSLPRYRITMTMFYNCCSANDQTDKQLSYSKTVVSVLESGYSTMSEVLPVRQRFSVP